MALMRASMLDSAPHSRAGAPPAMPRQHSSASPVYAAGGNRGVKRGAIERGVSFARLL